jgi:hypothetical protein
MTTATIPIAAIVRNDRMLRAAGMVTTGMVTAGMVTLAAALCGVGQSDAAAKQQASGQRQSCPEPRRIKVARASVHTFRQDNLLCIRAATQKTRHYVCPWRALLPNVVNTRSAIFFCSSGIAV